MTVELTDIQRYLHEYLEEVNGIDAEIREDTNIVSEGLVDSFGLIEIISFLEGKLGVTLPEGTLMPDDFDSVRILTDRLNDVL